MRAKPTRVIAHRGGGGAPENTLAAFAIAQRQGVRWIECDVSLLGDGTPILFHDKTFERTTNGTGALAQRDIRYLQELDAGSWFNRTFFGEPVPTLEDALRSFEALNLNANLELKVHADEGAELAAAVAAHLLRRRDMQDRFIISSFDHPTLASLRGDLPEAHIALLYGSIRSDWRASVSQIGASGMVANYKNAEPEEIKEIRNAGLFFGVYTVNQPTKIEDLWAAGLSSVITDVPLAYDPAWLAEIRA